MPISEVLEREGVFDVLTAREIRRKFLAESLTAAIPVEYVTQSRWNYGLLQQYGVFSSAEIEQLALFRQVALRHRAELADGKARILGEFDAELSCGMFSFLFCAFCKRLILTWIAPSTFFVLS